MSELSMLFGRIEGPSRNLPKFSDVPIFPGGKQPVGRLDEAALAIAHSNERNGVAKFRSKFASRIIEAGADVLTIDLGNTQERGWKLRKRLGNYWRLNEDVARGVARKEGTGAGNVHGSDTMTKFRAATNAVNEVAGSMLMLEDMKSRCASMQEFFSRNGTAKLYIELHSMEGVPHKKKPFHVPKRHFYRLPGSRMLAIDIYPSLSESFGRHRGIVEAGENRNRSKMVESRMEIDLGGLIREIADMLAGLQQHAGRIFGLSVPAFHEKIPQSHAMFRTYFPLDGMVFPVHVSPYEAKYSAMVMEEALVHPRPRQVFQHRSELVPLLNNGDVKIAFSAFFQAARIESSIAPP